MNLVKIFLIAALALPLSAQTQPDRERKTLDSFRWQVIRPVVRGERAAVAAGTPRVTEASMRQLHAGGNAVDAGVASLFAGSVSEFSHFGFGGEAPLLIRTPEGKVFCIPGLGPAPKLMTRDAFLSRRQSPDYIQENRRRGRKTGPIPSYGILPALVPGMVDAGLLALKQFGTRSFEEVIQPALNLADGHPIDEQRVQSIASATRFLRRFPTSLAVFSPGGQIPRPGDMFRQANLARTLRSMIEAERKALAAGKSRTKAIDAVRDHFYRGEIARKIGAFVKENDGFLRYEDFASFRLEVEEPIQTTFQGYEVYKGGFWTQGAVMIQALNILEGFHLQEWGWNSAEYIHALTEALKLAYADRDTWYADPDFSDVPDQLLSKVYAAQRRQLIEDVLGDTVRRLDAVCDCRRYGNSLDAAGAELCPYSRPSQRCRTRQAPEDYADADTGDTAGRTLHGALDAGGRSTGSGAAASPARDDAVPLQPAGRDRGPALPDSASGRQLRRPCDGSEQVADR